jgi:hypothetical protein
MKLSDECHIRLMLLLEGRKELEREFDDCLSPSITVELNPRHSKNGTLERLSVGKTERRALRKVG